MLGRFRRSQRIVLRTRTGACLHVAVAEGFRRRLLGLSFCDDPGIDGLLIPRCSSVHTFGMRFALDVAMIEWPEGRVLCLAEGVGRRRLVAGAKAGRRRVAALELPAGTARRAGIRAGEQLRSGPQGVR